MRVFKIITFVEFSDCSARKRNGVQHSKQYSRCHKPGEPGLSFKPLWGGESLKTSIILIQVIIKMIWGLSPQHLPRPRKRQAKTNHKLIRFTQKGMILGRRAAF